MKKTLSIILAVLMVVFVPLSFSGCKTDGNIKPIFKDNSYVSLNLPDYNKETECVLAVSNLAVQAQLNAMLKTELFYRLCENKASGKELAEALQESSEAWEAADVLSSSAYLMGKRLAHIEQREDYKSIKAMLSNNAVNANPFLITANAADSTLRMEKFEDAKEWAEYISRIYDHGKAGEKTAYVAKILKTDVNRAKVAVEMSQEILKGKADLDAGYDDATYKLLLKTKTAGKVAGLAAATIATGGASMGVLGATGFVAGGVDTVIEVADTTLTLTMGEDHQITKSFQDSASKVAPVISVLSFINLTNPDAWSNGAVDAVGQLRYVTDSAVDLVSNNKLFGIELSSSSEDGGMLKALTLPTGDEATDKTDKELRKALIDLGFDEKAVDEFIDSEPVEEEQAPEKPFSELTEEELDSKIEQIPLSNEEWEELFKEIYDDYLEEMHNQDFLEDDDGIWDYDPFMPFEDFPQDGDEIGFDDLSMWAKPEVPYEDEKETEKETTTEEDTTEEDTTEEEHYIGVEATVDDFMGTWHFTDEIGGEKTEVTYTMQLLSDDTLIATSSAGGASESVTCNYNLNGWTLTIRSDENDVGITFIIEQSGNLVAYSDEGKTVMHR